MSDQTISIVASQRAGDAVDRTDRGLREMAQKVFSRRIELSADDLAQRLKGFLAAMDGVVGKLPAKLGEFKLEEMTLSVEISAKGQVSLMGTGGEIGATGGITFTLRRSAPDSTIDKANG